MLASGEEDNYESIAFIDVDANVMMICGKTKARRNGLSMSNERLKDVVEAIVEAANEIKEKRKPDAQDYGQLLAYAECLSIIRDSYDGDLPEIGLDFDIDKRYL